MSDAAAIAGKPKIEFADSVEEMQRRCRQLGDQALAEGRLGDVAMYDLYSAIAPALRQWEERCEAMEVSSAAYLSAVTGVAGNMAAHGLLNVASNQTAVLQLGPKMTQEICKRIMTTALNAFADQPAEPAGTA